MTATLARQIASPAQQDTTHRSFWAFVLEPLFILASCLFWLVVLPLSAVFCFAVAAYDRTASLRTRQLRSPLVRPINPANPLVLRRKAQPTERPAGTTAAARPLRA